VLGYVFYASLMGAVGALVPSFQESGPLTFVVLLPAWLPFFVFELLLRHPHGWISRGLSLFPPTAPLVMTLRLTSGGVPWTDVALSLALLLAGAAAVLVGAALRVQHDAAAGGRGLLVAARLGAAARPVRRLTDRRRTPGGLGALPARGGRDSIARSDSPCLGVRRLCSTSSASATGSWPFRP